MVKFSLKKLKNLPKLIQSHRFNPSFNNPITGTKMDKKFLPYGVCGELVVRTFLKKPYHPQASDYEYDLVYRGKKIEIKTTVMKSSYVPQPWWTMKVRTGFQKCDVYVFAVISEDYSSGYITGWITKSEFEEFSKLIKKGEYLYPSKNIAKHDCHIITIDELYDIRVMPKIL